MLQAPNEISYEVITQAENGETSEPVPLASASIEATSSFPEISNVLNVLIQRQDDEQITLDSIAQLYIRACFGNSIHTFNKSNIHTF